MSTIIVDMGSGETCQNDKEIVAKMINGLAKVDTHKHKVIIKWQLFEKILNLKSLNHDVFDYAFNYAKRKGYQTTASIFDMWSMEYLLLYDIPFVKLACRKYLYKYLHTLERRDADVVVSISDLAQKTIIGQARHLCCVPEYPASRVKYESIFCGGLRVGISDHTKDFRLFKEYEPYYYEAHFKLPDSEGKDSGLWARTPEQWGGIL